jgi:hypothetical protein
LLRLPSSPSGGEDFPASGRGLGVGTVSGARLYAQKMCRFLPTPNSKEPCLLESAEFLRLSHGLILAFVSADPVLGNPIRLA